MIMTCHCGDLCAWLAAETGEMEDDRTWKEKVVDKVYQLLFDWECSPGWYRAARYVELFIMDPFVDLFIMRRRRVLPPGDSL